MLLVVALGLLAAFFFAAAATFQQHASRVVAAATDAEEHGGRLAVVMPVLLLMRRLVRAPLWLFGWVTNLVGFLTQAAALHLGSVALVQPLLVTQLLFTLPLASLWNRRWPLKRDWLAAASICAGVVIFLSVRGTAPVRGQADRPEVILAALVSMVLIGVLVLVSAGRAPAVHALGVAVAAGLCFALSAVFIKLTATDLLHRGVEATALDWPGYALAFSTLLGLLLEQEAFAAGPLSVAVAAMTITNPLASYLIGVLAFHVMPPTGPAALAAVASSGLLLFLGVVGLANSPAVRREAAKSVLRAD